MNKERIWRYLMIVYFGGGLMLALISSFLVALFVKPMPRELYVFFLYVYFVFIGVPFVLICNKLLLSKKNKVSDPV